MTRKRRQRVLRGYSLTLIELLIVIAIVGIAVSALAFPVARALDHSRFEQGVDRFISKVRLCQEIMMDYDVDMTFALTTKEDGVHCKICPMGVVAPQLRAFVDLDTHLKGISSFRWNAKENENQILSFFSSGALPQGKLTLVGKEEIDLYFSGILVGTKKKFMTPLTHEKKESYPEEAALLPFN